MTVLELDQLSPLFNWNAYLARAGWARSGAHVVTPELRPHYERQIEKESLAEPGRFTCAGMRAQRRTQPIFRPLSTGDFQLLRQDSAWTGANSRPAGNVAATTWTAISAKRLAKPMLPGISVRSEEAALKMVRKLKGRCRARFRLSPGWRGHPSSRRSPKLQSIANKVGYPDQWRDYSALDRPRRRDG